MNYKDNDNNNNISDNLIDQEGSQKSHSLDVDVNAIEPEKIDRRNGPLFCFLRILYLIFIIHPIRTFMKWFLLSLFAFLLLILISLPRLTSLQGNYVENFGTIPSTENQALFFSSLYLSVILLPIILVGGIYVIHHTCNAKMPKFTRFTFLGLVLTFLIICLSLLSKYLTSDLLNCGIIFCGYIMDDDDSIMDNSNMNVTPENMVGICYFCVTLVLLIYFIIGLFARDISVQLYFLTESEKSKKSMHVQFSVISEISPQSFNNPIQEKLLQERDTEEDFRQKVMNAAINGLENINPDDMPNENDFRNSLEIQATRIKNSRSTKVTNDSRTNDSLVPMYDLEISSLEKRVKEHDKEKKKVKAVRYKNLPRRNWKLVWLFVIILLPFTLYTATLTNPMIFNNNYVEGNLTLEALKFWMTTPKPPPNQTTTPTIQIRIGNYYYKLDVGVLLYFLFLYLVLLVGTASQMFPVLKRFLYSYPHWLNNLIILTWIGKNKCIQLLYMPISFVMGTICGRQEWLAAKLKKGNVWRMNVGTFGMSILWLGLVFAEFFYAWNMHYQIQIANPGYTPLGANIIAWYRSSGTVALVLTAMLMLPVSRNSVWQTALGISWEGGMVFHRILGMFAGIFAVMHIVGAVLMGMGVGQPPQQSCTCASNSVNNNNSPYCSWHQALFSVPSMMWCPNYAIPLAVYTVILLIPLYILSNNYFRRHYHELFYRAHIFAALLFTTMLLWHAYNAFSYLGLSLFCYLVDQLIRFTRTQAVFRLDSLITLNSTSDSSIVKLSYSKDMSRTSKFANVTPVDKSNNIPLTHGLGQYAFINIPAISTTEWHPFTISSTPNDKVTTHHIKPLGDFTKKLKDLADNGLKNYYLKHKNKGFFGFHSFSLTKDEIQDFVDDQASNFNNEPIFSSSYDLNIEIQVDGPYGLEIDYREYLSCIFLCGGIGVTPCISAYRGLFDLVDAYQYLHLERVELHWTSRSEQELGIFNKELDQIQHKLDSNKRLNQIFSHNLYYSKQKRPDVGEILRKAKADIFLKLSEIDDQKDKNLLQTFPSKILVFGCGPNPMMEDIRKYSVELGLTHHIETFEL